jgi:lipoate-protein ligase A
MEVFQTLRLWVDPLRRSGPESMAVDEWLLETATAPLLRVYRWQGDWASVGYFGKIAEAQAAIPRVSWVRRWTGGGIVDHRADWTYTLVVPQAEPLASWRGTEIYRAIHAALADALVAEGIAARLCGGDEETGAALCFENPVNHDLLGPDGRKLSGAGQRRSRQGLLHQGSVLAACGELDSQQRAEALAGRLARCWQPFHAQPEPLDLAQRVTARYARDGWTSRR